MILDVLAMKNHS